MLPPEEVLDAVLSAGIRAPSAENKHYLRFHVLSEAVELRTLDRPTWAAQPHRRMLALLSYGAVIENIDLKSRSLGFALEVAAFPASGSADVIARLNWVASPEVQGDPLSRFIEGRHTNRRFYRRGKLKDQRLGSMVDAARAIPGAELIWCESKTQRARALQAIRVAEAERFVGQRLHRELFGAVRFETGWRTPTDEWLAPAALEVELPMRSTFALLRHWGLMRTATRAGAHHFLGMRAGYLPSASASHLGLVAAQADDESAAALAAGRAFQRVWLDATAHDLALQPLAAATALVRQNPGEGWVRAAVKARLENLLGELTEGGRARPFMMFRVGRAAPPTAVAGRLALKEYLA